MKNFELKILFALLVCVSLALIFSCNKEIKQNPQEEIVTAKGTLAGSKCYPVCDFNKNPDLQLVTNAEEVRPLLPDGQIDSFSYFWLRYHVRTRPIVLTQNYVITENYALRYGGTVGDTVNRVTLECLVENVAPFGCENDWKFEESQGYLVGQNYFFDGLFEFETYEKGNGNSWKYLSTTYKKEFFPDAIPNVDNILNFNFCYYNRAIQAQMGDFYFNPFIYPNHDGIYKTILKFNPLIKGCRAVKETDYSNNEKTVVLEIREGQVIIVK